MRYLLALLLLFNTALFAAEQEKDYVVATVGSDKIYYSEIERSARGLNRFLKENFDTDRGSRLDFIRQYVARYALAKKAAEEGVDKREDVRYKMEQARMTILADELLGAEINKIKPSEGDLKAYYERNKDRYMMPAAIKISYVGSPDKKRIEQISEKVGKGKDLDNLAKRDIVKIDKFWISENVPFQVKEFEDVPLDKIAPLFSVEKGRCSGPMEFNNKYYIFRIDDRTPRKQMSFEEVRKTLEAEYYNEARGRALTDYISGVFSRESVVINESLIK